MFTMMRFKDPDLPKMRTPGGASLAAHKWTQLRRLFAEQIGRCANRTVKHNGELAMTDNSELAMSDILHNGAISADSSHAGAIMTNASDKISVAILSQAVLI